MRHYNLWAPLMVPARGMGYAGALGLCTQLVSRRSSDWVRTSSCSFTSQEFAQVTTSKYPHRIVRDSIPTQENCSHGSVDGTLGLHKLRGPSIRIAAVAAGVLGIGWMLECGAYAKPIETPAELGANASSVDKASNIPGVNGHIRTREAAESNQVGEKDSHSAVEDAVPELRGWCEASDEIYDSTDNLIVIFFDNLSHAYKESAVIESFRATLENYKQRGLIPKDITVCYSFRERTDGSAAKASGTGTALMLYKGQRRHRIELSNGALAELAVTSPSITSEQSQAPGSPVMEENTRNAEKENSLGSNKIISGLGNSFSQLNEPRSVPVIDAVFPEICSFFEPVSQILDVAYNAHLSKKGLPVFVSLSEFQNEVVGGASPKFKVLLQLFEDSCFLCFLMRPFINSISQSLEEYEIPLSIKRLDINKNDFPENCPVTRATPTFVLYDGSVPRRWEEFKPKDLVSKLQSEFDVPVDLRNRFTKFLDLLQDRHVELRKLESVFLGETDEVGSNDVSKDKVDGIQFSEKASFDEVVTSLIDEDMRRSDNIEENIRYLKQEIDSAQADCLAFAIMMGKELIRHDVESIQAVAENVAIDQ